MPPSKSSPAKPKTALTQYLQEIKDHEPLSNAEEVELAQKAKAGDTVAINKLVTHNLRFVVAVAKKFQKYGIPLEDLINEGNLGLIKAVQRFDETRGFRFISYAVWWISQSIRQAINKTGRTIRLPSNVTERMGQLYRQSLELEQIYEREPTSEELAEISNTTISWIESLIQSFSSTYSLDEPMDDSTATRVDFLTSDDDRLEKKIFLDSLKDEIFKVLHTLDEREEKVIRLYFGLDGDDQKNLEEIGRTMGLTGERIRQIKKRGLQRLRHSTRSQLLKIYLK
ncbi:MAG: RNA polymerase sigma factor RpoD/SigA [Candidatus Marinimicrobia bacterium]|nr:RNA polymerase sigma factor RpoD/SigA [Candidatus Neomarinimicrobiota bacterium]MDP6611691.1 RNA polymerase sigma factor RpoD/SigA [Candidatus Neomarinimicrobiota bacterium]